MRHLSKCVRVGVLAGLASLLGHAAQAIEYGDVGATPLEVTDAVVTATSGEIRRDEVIAIHTLRASEAIVVADDIKGTPRDVPAGSVLVRLRLDGVLDKAFVIWCDARTVAPPPATDHYSCFDDVNNQGSLSRRWMGQTADHFTGLHPGGAFQRTIMDKATAYRPATLEERPTLLLGYRYCGSTDDGTPKFALAIKTPEAPWKQAAVGECVFGAWPDPADRSKLKVDGLLLTVAEGSQPDRLRYTVEDRIPAGLLGRLGAEAPVRGVLAWNIAKSLGDNGLLATGAPTITTAEISLGQTFLKIPVRHRLTGRLRTPVSELGTDTPEPPLEAGQIVFGMPLGADGKVIWCAPRRKSGGGYDTVFLAPNGHWQSGARPAMWPTLVPAGDRGYTWSAAADVEPGPVDLPPMTLSVKLDQITAAANIAVAPAYHFKVEIDDGGGPQTMAWFDVPVSQQTMTLPLLGGAIVVKPIDPAGKISVEVARAPTATGPLGL